jgi:hypothetical protein
MIFPATSILTLVGLLVSPVFSAPIHVQGGSSGITSHPVHAGLEKRSPMFWGQDHHHHEPATLAGRDVLEYSDLVSRDESSVLEARSTPLAKRTEGESMRLVRRKSIFNKIKDGFKASLPLSRFAAHR